MKTTLKLSELLLIFTIIFTGLTSKTLAAGTYYISPSGSDGSGNGSVGSPWKTLAKACDSTVSGETIHVSPGTYLETNQCKLPIGVSIEGEGINSVIRASFTDDWKPIVLASSPEGTSGNQHISNIKFDGRGLATFWAVYIAGRSNVSVYNTTIVDFKDRGIIFAGKEDSEDGAPGIYATGNSYHDNVCSNSAAYNTPNGIYGRGCLNIGGQDGMLIYNNTITQNQRPEGYNGWPIKGWNDGHLKGVKIYNNTLIKKPYGGSYPGESGWDFAIELFNISGVEIYGNNIQGSIDSNTQLKGAYPYSVWIHDNTLSQPVLNKNYESGIILEFSTENAIIEKNIFNNVSMGVQFNTRDKSFVRNITIQNNLMTNLGRNIGDGNNGGAIAFISESTHNAVLSNINILNNTMIAAPGNEPWEGIEFGDAISGTGGSATNINIKNNIVIGFKDAWLRANTPTHTNQISVTNNNLYQNANDNMPLWPGGNPTNYNYANNLNVAPGFISGGYTLGSGSPLINAGINVGLPYNGGAPDIGYAESASTSSSGGGGSTGGGSGSGGSGGGSGGGSTVCPAGTTGIYPNCIVVPDPLPPVVAKFNIGDRVRVASSVNVRKTASVIGVKLGSKGVGALGTIVAGPISANGYVWYQVNYDKNPDGFSIENSLVKTNTSTVTITATKLNIRSAPTSGSIIGTVNKGSVGTIIAGSLKDAWIKVSFSDTLSGWVLRKWVK